MVIRQFSFVLVAVVFSFFSCQKQTVSSTSKFGANGQQIQAPAAKKKSTKGGSSFTYGTAVEEYEKRAKEVAKAKRKKNKDMKKPQYSNPTYFGHKKPPIKNPPGKKKYCEECGMWH